MIKLLFIEGEPSVRKGLRMRLTAEPDMTIVGEAVDASSALALTQKVYPDVVLMDLEMLRLDAVATTKALRAISPRIAVIMLTLRDDNATRARARAAGAVACITKRGLHDELLEAIRQAALSRTTQH